MRTHTTAPPLELSIHQTNEITTILTSEYRWCMVRLEVHNTIFNNSQSSHPSHREERTSSNDDKRTE